MSVYNKEKPEYLIESLTSLLNQTIPPEQIVVVKDGLLTSELNTVLGLFSEQHPGLFSFVSYSDNRGLWYALARGIPECRNELILRMDVDDWSSPVRAAKQLSIFESNPGIDCVGTNVVEFEGSLDNPISLVELPETNEEILSFGKRRCPYRHSSLMYRKAAVERAGSYQEMPMFEDYDLYMRLVASGCKFLNIQEYLVYMRTDKEFYARRGGFEYLVNMFRFKWSCFRRKDYGAVDFFCSFAPHVIVCLLPNCLRSYIYKRFLRKRPIGDSVKRP